MVRGSHCTRGMCVVRNAYSGPGPSTVPQRLSYQHGTMCCAAHTACDHTTLGLLGHLVMLGAMPSPLRYVANAHSQVMSEKSKAFLKNFDIDGDGTFSLEEFILLLVLLSMPLKDMQCIFVLMDADGSGELDRQEFMSAVEGIVSLTGRSAGSSIGRSRLEHVADRTCAPYPLHLFKVVSSSLPTQTWTQSCSRSAVVMHHSASIAPHAASPSYVCMADMHG